MSKLILWTYCCEFGLHHFHKPPLIDESRIRTGPWMQPKRAKPHYDSICFCTSNNRIIAGDFGWLVRVAICDNMRDNAPTTLLISTPSERRAWRLRTEWRDSIILNRTYTYLLYFIKWLFLFCNKIFKFFSLSLVWYTWDIMRNRRTVIVYVCNTIAHTDNERMSCIRARVT